MSEKTIDTDCLQFFHVFHFLLCFLSCTKPAPVYQNPSDLIEFFCIVMAFSRLPLARAILGRYLSQVGGQRSSLQFSPRVSFFSSQTITERTSAIDSDSCSKYHFASLSTRSVVHLSGPETCDFMQGK